MRGFTFIEVILVVSLAMIVGATAAWFSLHFLSERQTILSADMLQASLEQAHLYALSGKADTAWGITQQGSTLVLFAGNAYAERSPEWDEVWDLPQGVTVSGLGEIMFEKITGATVAKSFRIEGPTQTLSGTMNQEGMVQWYE